MGTSQKDRRDWRHYAVAAGAVASGAVLRSAFLASLGTRVAFVTLYPAVIVSALYGGLPAGLLATLLSAAVASYYWVEPVHSWSFRDAADWISVGIFLFSGAFISWVCEARRRAQARAVAADTEARLAVERQLAAEELQRTSEQARFLAGVIEKSEQPLGTGYPDGRMGVCNPAFCQLTGYSAEELRNTDWAKVLTPPEWLEAEMAALAELERTGRPVRYQKEYVRKDGTRVPIELLVHLERDAAGKAQYYYSFVTDISERKRHEEDLRRQREWLRVTLASIGDAVLAVDMEGRVTFLNPAGTELTGWKEPEALGRPYGEVFSIINEQTREPADDIVARVLREARVALLGNHTALVARDGREIPIEDSAAPIRDGAGMRGGRGGGFPRRGREAPRAAGPPAERSAVAYDSREPQRGPGGLHARRGTDSVEPGRPGDARVRQPGGVPPAPARVRRDLRTRHHRREGSAARRVAALAHPARRARGRTWRSASGGGRASGSGSTTTAARWCATRTASRCWPSSASGTLPQRKRAEQALRESEARMRALGDNLPEGAVYRYCHDREGRPRFEFVSAGIERLTGVPAAEVMRDAAALHATVLPGDLERLREAEAISRERLAPFEMELRQRHRVTGEVRWSLVRSMPTRRADGTTVWDGVQLDITARKQLEEQLRQRVEELETVMEVAPVAVWTAHDPQCREITGNRMANAFYEAGAGENVSANVTEVRRFLQNGRELTAEELPMQVAAARNVEVRNAEMEVVLPSDKRIYMLGHASPLRDEAGRVRGCVGAFLDITERRDAEESLRRSEAVYRAIARNIPDGAVAVVDTELRLPGDRRQAAGAARHRPGAPGGAAGGGRLRGFPSARATPGSCSGGRWRAKRWIPEAAVPRQGAGGPLRPAARRSGSGGGRHGAVARRDRPQAGRGAVAAGPEAGEHRPAGGRHRPRFQ